MIRALVLCYLRWRLANALHDLVQHQASPHACPLQIVAALEHIHNLRALIARSYTQELAF